MKKTDSLTDTERAQKEFWRGLAEKINHRSDTPLYADSVKPRNWFAQRRNLPSSVHYSFIVNTHQGYLQVKLHIKDDVDQIYEYLENRRTEIESEIGGELQWNPSPGEGRKATIILQRDGNIKTNRDRWDAYQNWLIEYGEAFDQVFGFHLQDFAE